MGAEPSIHSVGSGDLPMVIAGDLLICRLCEVAADRIMEEGRTYARCPSISGKSISR